MNKQETIDWVLNKFPEGKTVARNDLAKLVGIVWEMGEKHEVEKRAEDLPEFLKDIFDKKVT